MKIIEAMKKIKANREKVADLQAKIRDNSAHLSHETSPYDSPAKKVKEWAQSARDLTQESANLLTAISRTNLETSVSVEIAGKVVTKTIAEWVWRRREFARTDRDTFAAMGDRGLKEGHMQSSTGNPIEVKIVRNYDVEIRDRMMAEFSEEPGAIDAALEIANATTDLIGA